MNRVLVSVMLYVSMGQLGFGQGNVGSIVTRDVDYQIGANQFQGCLALDPNVKGRPGVLVVHEEGGTAPQARARATQWAKAGYVVFAADLYGKGILVKERKEALQRSKLDQKDRLTVRVRVQAALDFLLKHPNVDKQRVSAVGYGVGGTAVLELARTGVELEGVVCVHGDLSTPNPDDAKKIVASVLVLVGSEDPLIPQAQVNAFENEMRHGGVDWQIVRYGGVLHGFTNPLAGRNVKTGIAYDADADQRASVAIRYFLEEMFPHKPPPSVAKPMTTKPKPTPPANTIPMKVLKVLEIIDDTNRAPDGYEGGRTFLNLEQLLPKKDAMGRSIRYREWDVNPLRPGVNRGAERLVTGSDGSAYYTDDHYRSFKKIRSSD